MTAVWITGVGTINAAGIGLDATASDLAAGRLRVDEVDRSGGNHRDGGARTAALARNHPTSSWIPPLVARRMSPASRFAVVAARAAVDDAGLPSASLGDAAVVLATAYGAATVTEKLLRQIFLESPEAASPALFTESVANAPAAQVALQLEARGPNVTVTQRQAGAVASLRQAATLIRAGRTDIALAGAVDEVSPLLHAILDRFGALARPGAGGDEVPKPFDRDRDGWVAGEGATVLVLESAARARRRGACPLAVLTAAESAFDPAAPRSGWSRDPAPLASALGGFLGRRPGPPDVVVTGGCGARGGDRTEGLVLRSVLDPVPPLLAPKAILGDHGGALLAAAAVAFRGATFAAPPGFTEIAPEIGVSPWNDGELPPARSLLITSFAPGGAAAWTVLERP